jgi:hypothetical protein
MADDLEVSGRGLIWVLFQHWATETEVSHEKSQPGWPVFGQDCNRDLPQLKSSVLPPDQPVQ